MFNRKSISAVAATLLLAAISFNSHAAGSVTTAHGTSATANAKLRTIKVDADTKWVNVQRGETVTFVSGDGSFSWTFDTLHPEASFNLAEIAPSNFKAQNIRVFVVKSAEDLG